MSASAVALGWLFPLPNRAEIAADTPFPINVGMKRNTPITTAPTFRIIGYSPPACARSTCAGGRRQARVTPGGHGERGVDGQYPGERGQDLGAEVVLEEELDLPTGAGPSAVGIGLDEVPEVPSAAGFRPPRSKRAVLVGVAVASAVK